MAKIYAAGRGCGWSGGGGSARNGYLSQVFLKVEILQVEAYERVGFYRSL